MKKRLEVRPDEVEQIVFDAMKKRLDALVIAKMEPHKPDAELENIKGKIIGINGEIRKLMDRLADADDTLFQYIQARIKTLHGQKSELEDKQRTMSRKHKEIDTAPLADPLSRWDTLSVEEKHALAVTMIEVIHVSDETGVKIQFSI